MPLKKSKGNMYPWVTHTHSHLAGKCPHECSYCYVQAMAQKFPTMKALYSGPIRLIEKEFEVDYGRGKTIFIEHMNDLMAAPVPLDFILKIIRHCLKYPENEYVFQSKNPERYTIMDCFFPERRIFGTTIESSKFLPSIMHNAPPPEWRALAMMKLDGRKFVTIEPILDFDVDIISSWMDRIRPEFVNIGADSKGRGLPEPTPDKVHGLIEKLKEYGIEIREKHNLSRLLK
jgi:DNA repair photolyase